MRMIRRGAAASTVAAVVAVSALAACGADPDQSAGG